MAELLARPDDWEGIPSIHLLWDVKTWQFFGGDILRLDRKTKKLYLVFSAYPTKKTDPEAGTLWRIECVEITPKHPALDGRRIIVVTFENS